MKKIRNLVSVPLAWLSIIPAMIIVRIPTAIWGDYDTIFIEIVFSCFFAFGVLRYIESSYSRVRLIVLAIILGITYFSATIFYLLNFGLFLEAEGLWSALDGLLATIIAVGVCIFKITESSPKN